MNPITHPQLAHSWRDNTSLAKIAKTKRCLSDQFVVSSARLIKACFIRLSSSSERERNSFSVSTQTEKNVVTSARQPTTDSSSVRFSTEPPTVKLPPLAPVSPDGEPIALGYSPGVSDYKCAKNASQLMGIENDENQVYSICIQKCSQKPTKGSNLKNNFGLGDGGMTDSRMRMDTDDVSAGRDARDRGDDVRPVTRSSTSSKLPRLEKPVAPKSTFEMIEAI